MIIDHTENGFVLRNVFGDVIFESPAVSGPYRTYVQRLAVRMCDDGFEVGLFKGPNATPEWYFVREGVGAWSRVKEVGASPVHIHSGEGSSLGRISCEKGWEPPAEYLCLECSPYTELPVHTCYGCGEKGLPRRELRQVVIPIGGGHEGVETKVVNCCSNCCPPDRNEILLSCRECGKTKLHREEVHRVPRVDQDGDVGEKKPRSNTDFVILCNDCYPFRSLKPLGGVGVVFTCDKCGRERLPPWSVSRVPEIIKTETLLGDIKARFEKAFSGYQFAWEDYPVVGEDYPVVLQEAVALNVFGVRKDSFRQFVNKARCLRRAAEDCLGRVIILVPHKGDREEKEEA